MTIRLPGLVPALALLAPTFFAVGVAQAQQIYNPNGGQMAYPQPLASGQVTIPAATARDTGNMAYPASPGGITEAAPRGRDTGNMAYPNGGGSVPRATAMSAPMPAGKAPPMRPDVAPTPAQTAAARSLDMAPSSAPVPYTDFLAASKPMAGKGMMHHPRMPMHHTAMKKVPAKAAAAPAAAPAPAPAK